MHDLVVRDGRIVTPAGTVRGAVAVDGERIAGFDTAGVPAARRTIDAAGRLVIPGIIDSHVHVRDPGVTYKENFTTCSAAAASGGVTSMFCMPNTDPILDSVAGFRAAEDAGRRRSLVDFGLQALAAPRVLPAVADLAALGVVSFELFLGNVPESLAAGTRAETAALLAAIARAGAVAGVYPNDSEIAAELARGAGADHDAIASCHPPSVEAGALLVAAALAKKAGTRIHFRQMSSALAGAAAAWLRRDLGQRFTTEVTPHHLVLTEADAVRHGPEGLIMPPLRKTEDTEHLWAMMARGEIDAIGTDHSPHTAAEKAAGREDLRKAPPGFPGVETLLPALLPEFRRRGLGVEAFVAATASRPAKIFGLYPRKGAILPGSDADLAIVDDETAWTIDPARFFSKSKHSPFGGRKVTARADVTIVRGRVVYEAGAIVAEPGAARLLAPASAKA